MIDPSAQQKGQVGPTYGVTITMLIVGQIQVSLIMRSIYLKEFLAKRHFLNLIQFVIGFLSIQLYGFFYHIIVTKSIWFRIVAGLWTYQVNTFSIMKPKMQAPYVCLATSFILTYLMMLLSAIYGRAAKHHKRGLFISRHQLILWSERLFVVTCFGIIVCAELKNAAIEFTSLLIYTLMSLMFVIFFAASIRRPNFYHRNTYGDYILIGQLYYLNYFALSMSIVWTTDSFLELMQLDVRQYFI